MMHKTRKLLLATMFACTSMHTTLSNNCTSSASSACSSKSAGCSDCTQSQNLWQPHSFAISMAREIILEKPAWNSQYDTEGWHGTFGVGFEYMKSLGAGDDCQLKKCCTSIGAAPFWSANQSNQMTVGDNSGDYDLDAYQMGLGPVTTSGTVMLSPTIYQTGGDFFLYAGSHRTKRGFFAKLHAPVGLTCVDTRISSGGEIVPQAYPINELEAGETIDAPYANIVEAFQGGLSAGDLLPLSFGTIVFKRTSETKIGDIVGALGYNFYADERKHIGAAIRFTAPTGNRADAIHALQPIFGRNDHWAVGGELIGHWRVWQGQSCNNDNDAFLDIWFDGAVDHLFNSNQLRSFDLRANGMGSKYLLLANYANNSYQNEITNAANVTTIPISSSFTVEGDFALMLDYHSGAWSFGVGYEGWGRSCEQLDITCCNSNPINLNDYAILGRQNVINNLCQPTATISSSQNVTTTATETILDATVPANRLPEKLYEALNIEGQKAHAAYTNKAFGQISYTCKDIANNPYIAISGGAELSSKKNSAVSYWNIGIQGGLNF